MQCHGQGDSSAPPNDTHGNTLTTARGVGAHQAHLNPGPFRRAVGCDECHPVPSQVDSPGHDDGKVDVIFGGLASDGSARPVWSRATASCAATYCHGGTLQGGTNTAPIWTKVDGSQVACGTCHGVPPSPPAHPLVPKTSPVTLACAPCHPGTVKPDGSLDLAGGLHIDGVVETSAVACSSCHGDPARTPAELAPAPATGAHLLHLTGSDLRPPIGCAECHAVPSSMRGHPNGQLDMTWGPLARAGGASPSLAKGAPSSCAATYCHGATLSGGTRLVPTWTGSARIDAAQIQCDSCHGMPPPPSSGHPRVPVTSPPAKACNTCHPGTVKPDGSLDAAGGYHLNGYVEVSNRAGQLSTCTSCHGANDKPAALQPAPPNDLTGSTATTAMGVGAHDAHLKDGVLSRAFACSECHEPVASTDHAAGHGLQVQMSFGPLARNEGSWPVWDPVAGTCASVYCHGNTMDADPKSPAWQRRPIWNKVDGTQAACGTCHGLPPPPPHVDRIDCGSCHAGYTSASVNLRTHVDGVVQAGTLTCTSCHGDPNRSPATAAAAPPSDTSGGSATTRDGVGAHLQHLLPGPVSRGIACAECHPVPTNNLHADGTVHVVFGPLARTAGAAPTFDPVALTCATTYCHGATLPSGAGTAPAWTQVNGTFGACASCHGNPPSAATGHPSSNGQDCGQCHAGYTASSVNLVTHLNGVVDQTASCASCHGDPSRVPAAGQDPQLASAPPRDTDGDASSTFPGVGAHQAHLTGTHLRAPLGCTDCHAVPADLSNHPSGTLNLTWGALAKTGGARPAYDDATASCATTYCHGATLPDANRTPPVWNRVDGTFLGCTSCHANPPPTTAGHPASNGSDCATCHPGYSNRSVNLATHINGVVDAATSCTACHGSASAPAAIQAAPPKDTTGSSLTSSPGVGAHQAHLKAGPLSASFACTECHRVPADSAHATLPLDLTWGPLATAGGAKPTYDDATASCAASYCHGGTSALKGGTLTKPVWNKVDGTQAACGTCHRSPPPAPHVQNVSCGGCHAGYTSTAVGTAALATHVNGIVDTVPLTCTTCHGDAARTLVTGADSKTRAAPPRATTGAAAGASVGLHLNHLNQAKLGKPVACSECHPVPSSMTHADGTVQIAFGTLSKTGGRAPVWNATALSCAATYCHAPPVTTSGGFTAQTPTWTQTAALTCSTCHPSPPNDRCHPPNFNHGGGNKCNSCHKDTNSAGTAITNTTLHMNGVVDGKCSDCHRGESCTP